MQNQIDQIIERLDHQQATLEEIKTLLFQRLQHPSAEEISNSIVLPFPKRKPEERPGARLALLHEHEMSNPNLVDDGLGNFSCLVNLK